MCLLSFLGACSPAEYADVSAEPAFNKLIGTEFILREDVLIHGVTMEKNQDDDVDLFIVTTAPGFGGREVLSRSKLPAGSKITIKKVLECTTCPLDEDLRYEVQLADLSPGHGQPVHLSDLGGEHFFRIENGVARANPALLDRVK